MQIHPDPARLDVGTVIADTYEIAGLLGKGGMGSVFRAHHLRLPGKVVAIKVLHAEISDPEYLARFKREAEIASRLGHPNIITVQDFNLLPNGAPYLVLEFLEGEPLDARIARGALPLDQVVTITRQIGSALLAAHREGIVHRDLKPQNIFLCPTEAGGFAVEQVKVLDFGISKIRGSQTIKTQESTLLGTPQYMAPEQATGKHDDIDARTDIFALGAIVYEMLAGHPAFVGQTIPEVVFKVVYESPPPLATLRPDLPGHVVAATERALAKGQSDRFADVAAFVEALTGNPLTTTRRGEVAAVPGTASVAEVGTASTIASTGGRGQTSAQVREALLGTVASSPGIAVETNSAKAAANAVSVTGPVPAAAASRPRRIGALLAIVGAVAAVSVGATVMLLRGQNGAATPSSGSPPTQQTSPTATLPTGTDPLGTTLSPTPVSDSPSPSPGSDSPSQPPPQPDNTATAAAGAAEPPDQKKSKPPTTASAPPAVVAPPTTPSATRTKSPPSSGSTTTAESVSDDDKAGSPTSPDRGTASRDSRAEAKELLAELASLAKEGDAAVRSGDTEAALHVASRILQKAPSSPLGWGLRAVAYCKERDLSNAKAALRNLRGPAKKKAIAACKKLGLDLS